jgi:hypothetical protein
MKCDQTQDRVRGITDFGAAFLEKMNDELFLTPDQNRMRALTRNLSSSFSGLIK